MWWSYITDVGTFSIKPIKGDKYILSIDDKPLGAPYWSSHLAADAVATCSTGHPPWDQQGEVDHPRNLDEWQKHR